MQECAENKANFTSSFSFFNIYDFLFKQKFGEHIITKLILSQVKQMLSQI